MREEHKCVRVVFGSPRIGWKLLEPEWEIERIIWRLKE